MVKLCVVSISGEVIHVEALFWLCRIRVCVCVCSTTKGDQISVTYTLEIPQNISNMNSCRTEGSVPISDWWI